MQGPVTGGTETVLVVEDDEEVRATVVEMLTILATASSRRRSDQRIGGDRKLVSQLTCCSLSWSCREH